MNADVHHRRFAAIDDVADVVGYLVDAGLADPTALGCAGRSYGGYLTVAAMVSYPALFRGHEILGTTSLAVFVRAVVHWLIRHLLDVDERSA